MSAAIGLGLFLNVLFWGIVVSAAVVAATWAALKWFPGRRQRVRKGISPSLGRKASSQVSHSGKPEAERYRKAA